ncbi:MAG: diaminopimelate epimerase [Alphaproteobacteria bacterium]|nr:diaminopimelate epimerase [Alphaproteobacteria bacterium]
MKKDFLKMHGLGNDFAVFDARGESLNFTAPQIRAMADRCTGIGFDQLAILYPPENGQGDVFMNIFNASGEEVEACGNMTRCVATLLFVETGKDAVGVATVAGILQAKKVGDLVSVDMGPPRLGWDEIPLAEACDTENIDLDVAGLSSPCAVNTGNPHAVFFVEDAETVDLPKIGPMVEHHPLFPRRVNVEVATVKGPNSIRMRVWERGTGITRACGTAACATAVAAIRRGLTGRKVTVHLDGGDLDIEWRESDGHMVMTGPATLVYRGEIEID